MKEKDMEVEDIVLFEWLIRQHSWWDTVDVIAPRLMGRYFLKFPNERERKVEEWLASGNKWLIRSAILFQLKYRDKVDLDFLFSIIKRACGTKEFFINKAIGWILRENSKSRPNEIKEFIEDNRDKLAPLSIKEGLRLMK